MPRLVVMRHAQAGGSFGTADHDRALTERGQRDAGAAGAWLRSSGRLPDHIVCSPALRARQTLEGLGLDAAPLFAPRIYRNDVDLLFEIIQETPDDAERLLIVGHNPAAHRLVLSLTGGAVPAHFPPGALSVVEWAGGWSDAVPGEATLLASWTPEAAT